MLSNNPLKLSMGIVKSFQWGYDEIEKLQMLPGSLISYAPVKSVVCSKILMFWAGTKCNSNSQRSCKLFVWHFSHAHSRLRRRSSSCIFCFLFFTFWLTVFASLWLFLTVSGVHCGWKATALESFWGFWSGPLAFLVFVWASLTFNKVINKDSTTTKRATVLRDVLWSVVLVSLLVLTDISNCIVVRGFFSSSSFDIAFSSFSLTKCVPSQRPPSHHSKLKEPSLCWLSLLREEF